VSEVCLLGGMSRLHDDVIARVTAFVPLAADEVVARDRTLTFLGDHPDGVDATCQAGHVTATALVLSPDRRRTLLTLHKRIKRWIELGGHLEPDDADLTAASLREGIEESGISGLVQEPGILTIVVHEDLPCRRAPGTTHYDVYYVLTAPADAQERISDESLDLGWFDVDALPEPLGDGVVDVLGLALSRYPARSAGNRQRLQT
jgi:8-oxo-dGTP pyrophosphatase MutT (NUDIX family)